MPTTPEFFDALREWSIRKHQILKGYLPKFANILGSWHPTIYYVDGFAGAGQYGKENPIPGSPLIAANYAWSVLGSANKSYTLNCINVEPEHFSELCQATAGYHSPLVTNIHGNFRQALPKIQQQISEAPTLFLLDPYGYDGMEWDVISQLAQRATSGKAPKTELLISFMVSRIDKDAGWVDSPHPTAPAFVRRVNDLFGTDEWQAILGAGFTRDERYERLRLLYAERLESAFCGIVRSYPIRTIEGDLKYYVLYVTCNKRGCREMSDVIYKVEEGYRAAKAQREKALSNTLQSSMFDQLFDERPPTPQELMDEIVLPLMDDVYQLGARLKHTTFGEIQDELSTKWFGMANEKHYRDACRRLIRQGKISENNTSKLEDSTLLVFI